MKVVILDDYQETEKNLTYFNHLERHEITIIKDMYDIPMSSFQKLREAEILVLIRERTRIDKDFLSMLPNLKLISIIK